MNSARQIGEGFTSMQFVIKIIVSALIIAGVSELGKKYTPVAAILAALPLTSILAIIWLYRDTKDVEKVSNLSTGIFWAVLPSLLFFLPFLLKSGIHLHGHFEFSVESCSWGTRSTQLCSLDSE